MFTLRAFDTQNERTTEILDIVFKRVTSSRPTFGLSFRRARLGCWVTRILLIICMGNAATRTARAARGVRSGNLAGKPSKGDRDKARGASEVAARPPQESLRSKVDLPQGEELDRLLSMITSKTRRFADSTEIERRVPSRANNVQRKKDRLETKDIRRLLATDGEYERGARGEADLDRGPRESLLVLLRKHVSIDFRDR